MDTIPCVFIDAVLSLQFSDVSNFEKLQSKLWADSAKNQSARNVLKLEILAEVCGEECYYRLISSSEETLTLDEVQKLKYKRGTELKIVRRGEEWNGTCYPAGIQHFIRNVAFPLGVSRFQLDTIYEQKLFDAILIELLMSGYIFSEFHLNVHDDYICMEGRDLILYLLDHHIKSKLLTKWILPRLLPEHFYCDRFHELFTELVFQRQLRCLDVYHLDFSLEVVEALLRSWEKNPWPLNCSRTVNHFTQMDFSRNGFVNEMGLGQSWFFKKTDAVSKSELKANLHDGFLTFFTS
ncbi:hypothetical protein QR680_011695 [Steinernema hermaphroditum]|uniref:Uncharacterized protein n=1 Tax=Steinernema hermaphroditum TaxID=289476 RepID=A0AA39I166_9BILA|nr:hypothetical protein QR680_011695 [Steinernema hermaphroditum]